jgi:hypothetical protein
MITKTSTDGKVTLKLSPKRNEFGEFVVRWYDEGKRNEAKTGYTDDWDDAVGTLNMQMERYEQFGQ